MTKGETYVNQRTTKKERFSRIVRMHADKREEIDSAGAGDIVAVMGVDCASGDTFAAEQKYCSLESMFVPEPVIKMSVAPAQRDGGDKLTKALQRFMKEDPTFRVSSDEETAETLIAGMGELHLDIYVERIKREYKVEVIVGAAEGQLPRSSDAKRRLRSQAQEANRRFGSVRSHQGNARSVARRCDRDVHLRR
ncbi:MAG: EF-Tu/IF-2/RF-3 family GTPase [Pirellulales bacterium]